MTISNDSSTKKPEWQSVFAHILFAKAAVATFSIAPFLVGEYIDYLGLSPARAGQILSVEIFALAIANASAFFWVDKVPGRLMARILLVAIIFLNLACAASSNVHMLLVLRGAIGLLEGALLALGFGLISNSTRPDRNFGLYFAISLSIGAVNVRILPLFLQEAGVVGLFLNLSLYGLVAVAGSFWAQEASIRYLQKPDSINEARAVPHKVDFPMVPLILLMAANYIYFIGQGGVWSFLERIGQQQAFDLADVASALSLSLISGVAGGFLAGWLDTKWGRLTPLVIAISLAIGSIFLLMFTSDVAMFTLAVCLFNFGNNFGHPYVLGFASNIDKSARLTVLSGALHTGGQATGPLLVGLLVVGQNYDVALSVGLAAFFMAALMFVPVMAGGMARKAAFFRR